MRTPDIHRIYEYTASQIIVADPFTIDLPLHSKILYTEFARDKVYFWCQVGLYDINSPVDGHFLKRGTETRTFGIYTNGNDIVLPEGKISSVHIASQRDRTLVLHLFEHV